MFLAEWIAWMESARRDLYFEPGSRRFWEGLGRSGLEGEESALRGLVPCWPGNTFWCSLLWWGGKLKGEEEEEEAQKQKENKKQKSPTQSQKPIHNSPRELPNGNSRVTAPRPPLC